MWRVAHVIENKVWNFSISSYHRRPWHFYIKIQAKVFSLHLKVPHTCDIYYSKIAYLKSLKVKKREYYWDNDWPNKTVISSYWQIYATKIKQRTWTLTMSLRNYFQLGGWILSTSAQTEDVPPEWRAAAPAPVSYARGFDTLIIISQTFYQVSRFLRISLLTILVSRV